MKINETESKRTESMLKLNNYINYQYDDQY